MFFLFFFQSINQSLQQSTTRVYHKTKAFIRVISFFCNLHTCYYRKHVTKFLLIPWIYDTSVYITTISLLSSLLICYHLTLVWSHSPVFDIIIIVKYWFHAFTYIPYQHWFNSLKLAHILCVISHQKVTLTWGWRSYSFMFVSL